MNGQHHKLINYVPTSLVGRHVAALKSGGWTDPEIATAAGIDRRTVHNITTAGRPTVHRSTATAILKLSPCGAPNRVPATGAMRRLRSLAAMGWPLAHVGHVAGMYLTQVNDVAAGRRKRIARQQAEAIDTVYRALCGTPGPSPRTRAAAVRNGWTAATDDVDSPVAAAA